MFSMSFKDIISNVIKVYDFKLYLNPNILISFKQVSHNLSTLYQLYP